MKITITAHLKRRKDPLIQTFELSSNKPLALNPKILQDMTSLKISLEEEKPDVRAHTARPKTTNT